MKFFSVGFLFVIFFVALAFAQPQPEEDSDESDLAQHKVEPKITCQLLSRGGQEGNLACNLHCIALGYRGGYCNSRGVCVCR